MQFSCSDEFKLEKDDVGLVLHVGGIGAHIGFVYQSNDKKFKFVHLAFHKRVVQEPYPLDATKRSIFAKLPFSRSSLYSLKSALRLIGARSIHPSGINIPYGVNIMAAKGSFSVNGIYALPKGSDGLTCATFVSEICRGVGLTLLDENSWVARIEDQQWIAQICKMLEDPRSGADTAHIEQVKSGFSGLRIRPEEVASVANLWKGKPIAFGDAAANGIEVLKKLTDCCNKPDPTLNVSNQAASPSSG